VIDAKGVEIGTKADPPKTIDSRCGVHIPMRWSTLCTIYKYERGVHMPRVAGEKSFAVPMIAQGTERWHFHGHNGIEEIDDSTLVTVVPGYNFGCRHSPRSTGGGIIIALRPGALDEDERPLFARDTLRVPKLRNFGHALSIENMDEFDSFVFEIFDYVSSASLQNPRVARRNHLRIQRAKRFIELHATEPLSLKDMASCVGLSPFTFLRAFKAATGVTPHRYLGEIRLERAKHLLKLSHLSIAEVAALVGIRDQCYFARWFSKATAESPRRFRSRLVS
jgi:AraC-like DNA-binding protein